MSYPVSIEVAGPLAMFARPDTGSASTSYPAPTFSACVGIFESIARFRSGDAWIVPIKVEICKRRDIPGGTVSYQRYATNYGGPLRKANQLSRRVSMQRFSTVLANVCYRIYGECRGTKSDGANLSHYLSDQFQKRLRAGRCLSTPVLGWKEFPCSYWGAFPGGRVRDRCRSEPDDPLDAFEYVERSPRRQIRSAISAERAHHQPVWRRNEHPLG